MRNQLTHALNGNMNKGTKGKGKNKPIDHEVEFASAIRSALPEAAQLRLQSKLLQDEWDAPICEPQHLTSSGGVAICGKEVLPDLLARVGYTAKPCAILVAQEPDTLHLQGYPRSKVGALMMLLLKERHASMLKLRGSLSRLAFLPMSKWFREGRRFSCSIPWLRWLPGVLNTMVGLRGSCLPQY
jgi:hypothetical protein